MITTNNFCIRTYGEKLYKLSLNGGMTCPNRDGTLDSRGCIFCSSGGSGDFATDFTDSIETQIEQAKLYISSKFRGNRYIAYFQAFTNTYASAEYLRNLYLPVVKRDDIAVLSIATRPDCLNPEVLELLKELNDIKPVWVELGLQTIHKRTAYYIRRCYDLSVYDKAVLELSSIGIHVITHVILFLPGETKQDMLDTVKYVGQSGAHGIKLQLLHVLKNTDLATDFKKGHFELPTLEEYVNTVCDCIELLPKNMVVHRITGDGPKNLLIAPTWSANKKNVLNTLNREITKRGL